MGTRALGTLFLARYGFCCNEMHEVGYTIFEPDVILNYAAEFNGLSVVVRLVQGVGSQLFWYRKGQVNLCVYKTDVVPLRTDWRESSNWQKSFILCYDNVNLLFQYLSRSIFPPSRRILSKLISSNVGASGRFGSKQAENEMPRMQNYHKNHVNWVKRYT